MVCVFVFLAPGALYNLGVSRVAAFLLVGECKEGEIDEDASHM